MAKVIFGNHSSVLVPREARDSIRKFYCDILGGVVTRADPERDFVRLGDDFFIGFLYGDVSDESEFLRSFRAIWLELKSDNVEETSQRILASGLVRKLEVPDHHLYFQAPGGQCLRLVGTNEDLSFYEGKGAGPDVEKVKQAVESLKGAYTCSIETRVAPSKAYAGICNVSQWWTKSFNGCAKARGDKFKVRFGETFVDFEVIEAVSDKRIVWRVTDSYLHWVDNKEWNGTSVDWDIASANGVTTVKMTHHGLTPADDCYASCEPGWDFYVGKSLVALIKNGDGLPDGM